jgi:multimeric flavodoxin WrbA
VIEDDFQNLREKINRADALVFSTPVYFGDLSESAKRFLDRWRRCESVNRETSQLKGKRVIGIAAAGGSGGGAVNALHNLETYLRYLQFTIFDLVPVTQVSKKHKIDMLRVAGERLVLEL